MAITEEQAHDIAVHHRIALGRYSNTVIRRVMALSNRIEKDIIKRLGRADITDLGRTRLEQTLAELRTIQASGWAAISDKFLADMDALAGNEMAFGEDLARAAGAIRVSVFTGAPSLAQVVAAARARPFQGRIMKDWLKDVEEGQARRVREVIRQGVVEGQTVDQMVRALRGTKAAQYQDGALEVSRRAAETMVRTAVTHVSNVAQMQIFEANSDVIKAWKFCATLDSRTSLICASLHGKEFPLGSGPLPPRHPNCLIADSHVATGTRVTSVFKRRYDGDAVVISTAGGKQLTCTPNHPILTDRGWVAAGLLNVGGNVICDAGIKRMGLVDPNSQDVEARIEDVAETLLASQKMMAVPVPTAAEDFHGDGVDGEVAIVATDRGLGDGREASFPEHRGQAQFAFGRMGLAGVTGDGPLRLLDIIDDAASNRSVSRLGEALSLGWRRGLHACSLLLRAVADFVTPIAHQPDDGRCASAQVLGNSRAAHSGDVEPFGLINIEGDRISHDWSEPQLGEAIEDRFAFDADLARYLLNGHAGPVEADVIVNIERTTIGANVFNLETEGGWYVAENIITHNCRSIAVPKVAPIAGVKPFTAPTFSAWLKNQPLAVQENVLGVSRTKLFLSGGLTLDRFVDRKGATLTLDQLRQRDASAFAKAGLS